MSELVPELRFSGFSDDWVQRKLGEQYKKVTEKNDLSFGNEKIISVANMYFKSDALVSSDKYMKTYNVFRLGDIAFEGNKSKNFSYGRFVENIIGDGIVSHVFDVFRPINKYDLYFWKYIINYEPIMGHLLMRSTTKATMMNNLVSKDFLKQNLFVPLLEEQIKIGSFLKKLDDIIVLHQREIKLLKSLKTGLLQNMFPSNGESVPKLRFANFDDEWVQRNLGDITDRFDNLRIPITASDRIAGGTPYYGANGIQDYVEGFTHDGEFILVAEDGANDLKNYPVQYVYGKVWVNNHAHVLQGKKTISDNKFLMNAIKNFNIEPLLVGGGRAKLNADVMMKIKIQSPSYKEQIKVGSLFKQIDDTIALHHRQLDLLKLSKKGLLQKMFV